MPLTGPQSPPPTSSDPITQNQQIVTVELINLLLLDYYYFFFYENMFCPSRNLKEENILGVCAVTESDLIQQKILK